MHSSGHPAVHIANAGKKASLPLAVGDAPEPSDSSLLQGARHHSMLENCQQAHGP